MNLPKTACDLRHPLRLAVAYQDLLVLGADRDKDHR
jgi:hypothetical protein